MAIVKFHFLPTLLGVCSLLWLTGSWVKGSVRGARGGENGTLRGGKDKFTGDVELQAGGLGVGSCRDFLKVEEVG